MGELEVCTEGLRREAEETVSNLRRLKEILEEQRSIIRKMGGYWKGEGYETATRAFKTLSEEFSQGLGQLEEIPERLFAIAQLYEKAEQSNEERASRLPDSILD